ncbi:hypothetical protein OBBRIDRAFT_763385 [Obba rivulosa]|uniref:Peptidase S54 rhomboid domain-containing protein n=1 Tax=Obba rivulosa TaxID=1052685 RepID=A0A8E2ATQ2_9APHY|nr:hypothetical protein OBBRIDRAFT_763385 [Obba rivulosa]
MLQARLPLSWHTTLAHARSSVHHTFSFRSPIVTRIPKHEHPSSLPLGCIRSIPRRSFSFTPSTAFPEVLTNHGSLRGPTPSFAEHVVRTNGTKSFSEQVSRPGVRKQVLFVLLGSVAAFGLAAAMTNYETLQLVQIYRNLSLWSTEPSNKELLVLHEDMYADRVRAPVVRIINEIGYTWPQSIAGFAQWALLQIVNPLIGSDEGRRMCWAIGAFNGAIFLLWRFKHLKPFMMRHFTHNPLSGKAYTMLTSTFSHATPLHYLFNTLALASFGAATAAQFQQRAMNSETLPEGTVKWQLLAFIVTGGLMSALTSHLASAYIIYPRLLSRLTSSAMQTVRGRAAQAAAGAEIAKEASTILPSLGISGAVYSAFVYTAFAYPDTHISLIFLPNFPIPIAWGATGMVMVDLLGAMRGWRFLDHFAHLGGAAFGAFYWVYGQAIWEHARVTALRLWSWWLNVGPSPEKRKGWN